MVVEGTLLIIFKDKVLLSWTDPDTKTMESGLCDRASGKFKEGDIVKISLVRPIDKNYFLPTKYWIEAWSAPTDETNET